MTANRHELTPEERARGGRKGIATRMARQEAEREAALRAEERRAESTYQRRQRSARARARIAAMLKQRYDAEREAEQREDILSINNDLVREMVTEALPFLLRGGVPLSVIETLSIVLVVNPDCHRALLAVREVVRAREVDASTYAALTVLTDGLVKRHPELPEARDTCDLLAVLVGIGREGITALPDPAEATTPEGSAGVLLA